METNTFLAVLALCLGLSQAKSSVTQSLDGTWVGRETDYYYEFPTTVPGGVYSDLMNTNIIDDIFTFYNDNDTVWVGTINWTYALNFTVDPTLLDFEHVNLVFDGVDTFADVVLNDVIIGATENMFVRYIYDVKDILKAEGNNTVRLLFRNAPEVGLNLNTEQLKKYRIPWECPPDAYHGQCHINMLRKMQASFSWDWGPSFPSMGIWKPVYLQAFDEAAIEYVVPRVEYSPNNDETYDVIVDTYFETNKAGVLTGTLTATIYVNDGEQVSKSFEVDARIDDNNELVQSVTLSVDRTSVDLWWPNGYGSQPLYELVVEFTSAVDHSTISKKVKIGVRFVELVQDPLEEGATYYFKVNDVPIFAKGSNEIPIDILPERGQDRQKIRYLLESAVEVNMNMLRVWGGGVYESDYFYEVADELGLMIWQDFMFACSLYPATETYLSNVRTEVVQNVKRLYYHPSIVVFSGNNENEGVLADNWYGTADLFDTYQQDYVALYIDTVRTELNRITADQAVFVSSSPTNGKLTEEEGWVKSSPSNALWGDVHYYNYILDPWDSNTYPIPRFCSEYGYQSMPVEDAWLTATNDTNDLDLSGKFMDWRQHHPEGNAAMALLILENLNLPSSDSEAYTSAVIYLSQVYVAQSIKVESEHYRRYRSYLTDDNKGYTMGALYWQLNDVWVAPTWSSIDFTGRWKMLHYFARNFFANVIVTGHFNTVGDLQLYTVNDQLSNIDDVSVLVRIYKYDSPDFKPISETRLQVDVASASSQLIETIETETVLAENGCDKTSCFFYFVAQKNASISDSVIITPENYAFPGKLKDSSLGNSNVQITEVRESGKNTFDVTVTTDNIALFVWLESHQVAGHFSDNGFLQVEPTKTVTFYGDSDVTLDEIVTNLSVTHLKDTKWV